VLTGLAVAVDIPVKEHWVNPAVACATCRHTIPSDSCLLPFLYCHLDYDEMMPMSRDHSCPEFNTVEDSFSGRPLLLLETPIVVELFYREDGNFHKKTFVCCSPYCYNMCTKPEINHLREGYLKVGTMITNVVRNAPSGGPKEGPDGIKFQRMITHTSNITVTTQHAGSGIQLAIALQRWAPTYGFHKLIHLSHPAAFLVKPDDQEFFRRAKEFAMLHKLSIERDIRWLSPYHHPSQEVMVDDQKLLGKAADFMNETNLFAIYNLALRPPYSPRLAQYHNYTYSLTTDCYVDVTGDYEWGIHSMLDTDDHLLDPESLMEVHEASLLYRLSEGMATFGSDELCVTIDSLSGDHSRTIVYQRRFEEDDLLSDETLTDVSFEGSDLSDISMEEE
jgi:hypothetical protein